MTDLNPLEAGDDPYPQYNVTTTMQIDGALQITKGTLYTTDTDGRLVVIPATGFANGVFQAKATPTAVAVEADEDAVQVLGPRSRIIMIATAANLVVGEDVVTTEAAPTNVVTGTNTSVFYLGKVFEIYTVNTDSTKKLITAIGDKVIVETVQA